MTRADIVQTIYNRVGAFSKREATDLVELVFETMKETLERGERIKMSGFGNFVLRDKHSRVGRNPQTGKELKIAATTVPRFTAGAGFKAAVAGKKAAKKK